MADKFHVIQLALRAMQDIRVRYRQEVLTQERLKKQDKKKKKKFWEKKDDDYNSHKSVLPN
ncbi:MAG: transposase [Bacteroidetes bacterium]|nr:transposase [Bacteroidota bacterium]